jgi:hypothetical protein
MELVPVALGRKGAQCFAQLDKRIRHVPDLPRTVTGGSARRPTGRAPGLRWPGHAFNGLLAQNPAASGLLEPTCAPRSDAPDQRPQAVEREQQQDDRQLDIQAERLNRFEPASFHDLLRAFARWLIATTADATPNVLQCSIFIVKYL